MGVKTNQFRKVWSWGIVVWEIFNQGALPYGDLATNLEVTEAVSSGRRLDLGNLKSSGQLAKLAALVEDSWDRRADARPTFKHLARVCQRLVEELQESNLEDDGDAALVLKKLQNNAYAAVSHDPSSSFYGKPEEFDDHGPEIAKNSGDYEHEHGQGSSSYESESDSPASNELYEHARANKHSG
jgi:Protein tyrosine and serine/threonine kinase